MNPSQKKIINLKFKILESLSEQERIPWTLTIMAQSATLTGTDETESGLDLQEYLNKHGVSPNVFTLLDNESITINDLVTSTNAELEEWSHENNLNTIERRRLLMQLACYQMHN